MNLDSSVAGDTTVKASWTGQATTAEGSATMSRDATAIKHWISPAMTLDKKVDGGDHKPVADALQAPADSAPHHETRTQALFAPKGDHATKAVPEVDRVQVHIHSKGQAIGRQHGEA